ncbi:hypothetical protein J6590_028043, partial [Homalodisca vitripennis]
MTNSSKQPTIPRRQDNGRVSAMIIPSYHVQDVTARCLPPPYLLPIHLLHSIHSSKTD